MSTLFVDTINEKTTNNGVYIPGHVLQVKRAESNTTIVLASESFVDCLSINITPSATTSKFLINTFMTGYVATANGGAIRILRDSTEIFDPNNLNSSNQHYYTYSGSGGIYPSYNICHLDAKSDVISFLRLVRWLQRLQEFWRQFCKTERKESRLS